ncbi:MAG: hypothetical protein JWO40_833 [Candidatus Doudnabacteria bacterium]|nr:hypothetical protein [Candidatus Doudnabacteria bacterium]
MYIAEKHFNDFGLKNVALIAVIALVLGTLAWTQKPLRLAAVKGGTGLSASLADLPNNGGQVLGATEYNQQLIQQFEPNDIRTSEDNSQQAFVNYADQVNIVKNSDNIQGLLTGNSLQSSKDAQDKFISDLKRIAAPSALSDYHKLLLAYYQLRFNAQSSLEADQMATYAVAVQGQLDLLRTNYQTSAEVALP